MITVMKKPRYAGSLVSQSDRYGQGLVSQPDTTLKVGAGSPSSGHAELYHPTWMKGGILS